MLNYQRVSHCKFQIPVSKLVSSWDGHPSGSDGRHEDHQGLPAEVFCDFLKQNMLKQRCFGILQLGNIWKFTLCCNFMLMVQCVFVSSLESFGLKV